MQSGGVVMLDILGSLGAIVLAGLVFFIFLIVTIKHLIYIFKTGFEKLKNRKDKSGEQDNDKE